MNERQVARKRLIMELLIMRRLDLFCLTVALLLAGPAIADKPVVEWEGAIPPSPQQRSLPPVCTICLHGQVGFDLLALNTLVNLRAEYIVNYSDYGVPEGRSGTLVLGFFLFPGNFEALQLDDINPFNHANVVLSSLGGAEAYFQDVDEIGPVIRNLPSIDQYFAYLFLGEIVEILPDGQLRAEVRDFAVMHPPEQPGCGGDTCLFSAPGGTGGNTGGVGQGGGSEGGGNQESIDKDEELREPTERAECIVTTRNRANPDQVAATGDASTLIAVLDNDVLNTEGGFGIVIDAQPANGSAEVIGDSIRYTPDSGFEGEDFLTYRIHSVCGLASFARVDIVVERQTVVPPANCPLEVKLPGELAARSGSTSLLNISTRGLVGDCNNTLRAGFINVDSEATYFIRGRGPSLGGSNPLSDPRIRLLGFEVEDDRLVEVELASNDDWLDHPTADCLVPERQLEPVDGREAALLITLPAGTYIAVLESATADGTCSAVYGNGIIEVNDVRLFPDDVQP
jgi:hypothetical protein